MRTLSVWLWLIAYGSGLYALTLAWKHGFTGGGKTLFAVCLVAGVLGILVDRIRAVLS